MIQSVYEKKSLGKEIVVFWICFVFFMTNDLWWMAIKSPLWFYISDFLFRIVIIALLVGFLWSETKSLRQLFNWFFLRHSNNKEKSDYIKNIIFWSIFVSVAGVAIDQVVWPFLMYKLPRIAFFEYPYYTMPFLKAFDLTFGIALAALTEELVFRALAIRAFSSITKNKIESIAWYKIAITCCLFGLIHWSLGLHAIITTALWGILPMIALIVTGSLWPAVIAHIVTNIVAFSGIVPLEFYKLLQ